MIELSKKLFGLRIDCIALSIRQRTRLISIRSPLFSTGLRCSGEV